MDDGLTTRTSISASIRTNILEIIAHSDKPVSTLEIGSKINRAWHSVQTHCLRLQVEGKIDGFKVGNMNLWTAKRDNNR
jgi:repressor of nif and glnA expression